MEEELKGGGEGGGGRNVEERESEVSTRGGRKDRR